MIYKNVEYTERPESVVIEQLPEGGVNVWLNRNVGELIREEAEGKQTTYTAETAFFYAADPLTADDVVADFDGWWEYAEGWTRDQQKPTLEQRMDDVEAALLAVMGM